MTIIIKAVPVETYWSIEIVKRFHPVLKRAYKMIMKNLAEMKISKKIRLQITVKAINDTAKANGLVFTFLIFHAYLCMHHLDPSASNIIQRAVVISKTMSEVRKMMAEKQIRNVLNFRNGSIVNHFHDLSINSEILVWRESNAGKTSQ